MSAESGTEVLLKIADLMDSRSNVYKILSRSFREEMDVDFADELANDFIFESNNDGMMRTLSKIKESLNGLDDDSIEQMAVVFDRVFFGMGPLTARHAFPYESVYTSDKGIMMQDAYAQVVRTYREQHLAKDAKFTEPEDHLAVELVFMATLSERAAVFLREGHEEAAEQTISQQLAFLRNHLLNWIDLFCADLIAATGDGFYMHLADFTKSFIHEDEALLADILE